MYYLFLIYILFIPTDTRAYFTTILLLLQISIIFFYLFGYNNNDILKFYINVIYLCIRYIYILIKQYKYERKHMNPVWIIDIVWIWNCIKYIIKYIIIKIIIFFWLGFLHSGKSIFYALHCSSDDFSCCWISIFDI